MKNKKRRMTVLLIVLLLIIIIGGIFVYQRISRKPESIPKPASTTMPVDDSAADWQGSQQLPQVKGTSEMIAIPGFDSLVFAAGETKQQVNFYNPKENTCLFTMSLLIDGEELWRSGNVEAGKGFYDIVLSRALDEGTYTGIQHIECHTPEGVQLNSANVEFILTVQ